MNDALASLITAASLIGAPASQVPAPLARPAAAHRSAGETVVAVAPLADVVAAQSSAFVARPFGPSPLRAAAAFDANGRLWIKLRQGDRAAAFSEARLRDGATVDLPADKARLSLERDGLHAVLDDGTTALFTRDQLLASLYASAMSIPLSIEKYGALYEDGDSSPASVCLLRRAGPGRYFVTSHALAEMKTTQWIMASGDFLYGMRLDGGRLVFVAKPLPSAAAGR